MITVSNLEWICQIEKMDTVFGTCLLRVKNCTTKLRTLFELLGEHTLMWSRHSSLISFTIGQHSILTGVHSSLLRSWLISIKPSRIQSHVFYRLPRKLAKKEAQCPNLRPSFWNRWKCFQQFLHADPNSMVAYEKFQDLFVEMWAAYCLGWQEKEIILAYICNAAAKKWRTMKMRACTPSLSSTHQ